MTEAILIEITQRFRRLEDVIGKAQDWLMTIDTNSDTMGPVNDAHIGLEVCADACREDMVAMQELIRRFTGARETGER